MVLVLLLPLGFIPLLGYAVEATRSASAKPGDGPPPWRLTPRLLADGFWVALAIGLLTTPFALVAIPLAGVLSSPALWHSADPLLHVEGWTSAILVLALPWGITFLLLMPHATARFAASGRPIDLFDLRQVLRAVRQDFATWNVVIAAIVTGWAVGLACVGLLCIGAVPGIFYAILVSAYATAALRTEDEDPSAR